ncbi:MAG: ADP-ribosylglycohydrolase family protein [Lachnospiraceae bacterium]|nr:ADP-ribosylglycohydrolase family protein [Lachnospiraceae bacterium]
MYGAILGDIIGSIYEFDQNNIKTKEFPLFGARCTYTDDSVMALAVAKVMCEQATRMELEPDKMYSDEELKKRLIASLIEWGQKYPDAGYGARFIHWLNEDSPQPYNSWGNGSAMRVASVGWLFEDLDYTRKMARLSAEITHNHPEGIKGAESVASAIFLAREGKTKEEIKEYIVKEFSYDLSRKLDDIRPTYHHVESCQETVPEAITAFLEGNSFEDVIRNAVSLGGDCDTLTCIAGSIAEAFYLIPFELLGECEKRLPEDLAGLLLPFKSRRISSAAEKAQFDKKIGDMESETVFAGEVIRNLMFCVYHYSYEDAYELVLGDGPGAIPEDLRDETVEDMATELGYGCG